MTSNTQNKIYYNKKIKKYNIEIAKHVNRLFNKNDHISLLDLGCGNAGLIFMLTKKFKNLIKMLVNIIIIKNGLKGLHLFFFNLSKNM